MKFFNLGELDWKQTQLIYHALAYKNIEGLVLHSSYDRYICVGLHQDPRDELDLDYCKKNNIGVFRREVGGGTVLLDNNQLFYNLIINRNNPNVPYFPENFFRKYLQPVIQTYHELGIPAEFRPLCDLIVNEKKISGNGGGEIGECKVLGGNILLDFDYKRMARSISSPDNLREKFLELMQSNITTVKKELGFIPPKEEISSILVKKFEDFLGPMTKGRVNTEITEKMMELNKRYSSDKWLYQRGVKQIGREIKVREGVFLFYKEFDSKEGNWSITCEIGHNRVKKVSLNNAFFLSNIEKGRFSEKLLGLEYERNNLANKIIRMIETYGVVAFD